MIRTLLIPGLDGSPAPHWQAWWQATDPGAKIVEQISWSSPTPEASLSARTATFARIPDRKLHAPVVVAASTNDSGGPPSDKKNLPIDQRSCFP